MTRLLSTLLTLATVATAIGAQPVARNPQPAAGALQVWLITFGEGEQYWEKYGHNALWFRDTTQGIDEAYNWGMFDFRSPGYLKRLLVGDMQYWVEAFPAASLIEAYRQLDRTVIVQRLNLTPAQAARVHALARHNATEEHKHYRYDYFRDNCSTRVRDMIDAAMDGGLKAATDGPRIARSYRSETLRLVDDLKLTQLGIDIALGRPADRPLTVWENAFVPSRLREIVARISVRPSVNAPPAPLVLEERTLHQSRTHREREDSPRYWLAYLTVGVALSLVLVVIGSTRGKSATRDRLFRALVAVWSVLTGGLGLILLLAWLITDHTYWYGNRNLFLVNPISLFIAALAPLSLWKPSLTRPAAILALVVAASCGLAIVVSAIPVLNQDNAPLIFLLVPPHLAVASGLLARVRNARA